MNVDLPPLWLPPKPAIIRPAEHAILRPGAFRPCTREERRAIIADLVHSKRITADEATRAVIFLVPVVGWNALGPPPTVSYVNHYESGSALLTYSFTASLGTAASNRRVYVFATWVTNGGTIYVVSGSINGVTATIEYSNSTGNNTGLAILSAVVPTGTSGTVSFTLSDNVNPNQAVRAAISVFAVYGQSIPAPVDLQHNAQASGATNSVSLNVKYSGSVVLAAMSANGSPSTYTWSGPIEDYDYNYGGNATWTGAHASSVAANASYSASATTNSQTSQIAAVAIR